MQDHNMGISGTYTHNMGISNKVKVNLVIIFAEQRGLVKKKDICIAYSVEKGHKKSCRLHKHQYPNQKRLQGNWWVA